MSEITNVAKVQEAAIRVQAAAKSIAEAAKDNKKTVGIIAACVGSVALIGATAYVVTKMVKPTFICVKSKDDENVESEE